MIEPAQELPAPQTPVQLEQTPVAVPQTPEEPLHELKFRNSWKDWGIRCAIFVVFLFFASGKFKNAPDAPWVVLFNQIGLGQWLRYFTGVLEVIGAFLVLFSGTVELGLILLGAVMFAAVVLVISILHRPSEAFFAAAFLCAFVAFWLHRRRV